ncbi:glycine-rich domain-containing protein [Pseudobacter ginsenosidimutans]|uniref:TIGR04222 domain-containing membrane protein n=1 Tax=Pseudobacter ginsenosidimutans TaxID=661488 RepID=A0A4Q7MFM4_9BACT|nr:hypothetical protein [Pseudobacter ginsenosidimutans]RZS66871.1 hypothetical protein EV199_5255 [Pseudobacter ginsenosidimutans]
MQFNENPIWRKLEIFSIDPPDVSLSFEQRLARENSWSVQFASQVLLEYKKFLFLCASQDHPCTPSDAVDQAWHLHLAYTKSYWNDLCENVLGKKIHHNPTEGGTTEQEKFEDYYERTLSLYRNTFNTEPPEDIWPSSQQRFSDIHFTRVNRQQFWVVPKRSWIQAIFILSIAGVAAFISQNFVFLLIGGLVALVIASPSSKKGNTGSGCSSTGCGGGCSTDGHSGCSGDGGCSSGCSGCGGGCGGD